MQTYSCRHIVHEWGICPLNSYSFAFHQCRNRTFLIVQQKKEITTSRFAAYAILSYLSRIKFLTKYKICKRHHIEVTHWGNTAVAKQSFRFYHPYHKFLGVQASRNEYHFCNSSDTRSLKDCLNSTTNLA